MIAPLIWPFIETYIAGVIYILLTGTTIELSWKVGFYNLHRYWWGYGVMIFCGVPLILICRKYHWNKPWQYILGAGLLALIVPLLYWVGAVVIFDPQHASSTELLGLVASTTHMLLSGAITFMLVILIFWFIAVRKNEWFAGK